MIRDADVNDANHIQPIGLSREQAARFLGIGLRSLDRLTASREIPSAKIGDRRLFYTGDLEHWLMDQVRQQAPGNASSEDDWG